MNQKSDHINLSTPATDLSRQLSLIIKDIEFYYDLSRPQKPAVDLWSLFEKLPDDHHQAVLRATQEKLNLLQKMAIHGKSTHEDDGYLSELLASSSLKVPPEVFDKIKSTDVVELYNRDFLQIYHNQVFVDHCNYTLAELITIPWFQLYDRPSYCDQYLIKQAQALFAEGLTMQEIQLDSYIIRQLHGNAETEFIISHKFVCPVINNSGQVQALLYVNEIETTLPQDGKIKIL